MSDAIFTVPFPVNEPVLSYAPGSPERAELKIALAEAKVQQHDVPMYIGGKHVFTEQKKAMHPPHERSHVLGHYARGNQAHVQQAIEAALAAKPAWEAMAWQDRAAIFLKAADLLCGPYRARMNAATMLCQSKNPFQAEIDAVCELADFWRFNAHFMQEMYKQQPISPRNTWNRLDWRPLEGFIFALTPSFQPHCSIIHPAASFTFPSVSGKPTIPE